MRCSVLRKTQHQHQAARVWSEQMHFPCNKPLTSSLPPNEGPSSVSRVLLQWSQWFICCQTAAPGCSEVWRVLALHSSLALALQNFTANCHPAYAAPRLKPARNPECTPGQRWVALVPPFPLSQSQFQALEQGTNDILGAQAWWAGVLAAPFWTLEAVPFTADF